MTDFDGFDLFVATICFSWFSLLWLIWCELKDTKQQGIKMWIHHGKLFLSFNFLTVEKFYTILQPIPSQIHVNWPIILNGPVTNKHYSLDFEDNSALKVVQMLTWTITQLRQGESCVWLITILHRNNTLVSAGGLSFLHSLLDLAFNIKATWKKPNKSCSG